MKRMLLNNPALKFVLAVTVMTALFLLSSHVYATDLLAGTDTDVKDTIEATGKHWMLWIDGAVSLASFAYTKKPTVFFSVLGISLFISALIKMAA